MFLQVTPAGSKRWRIKYRYGGKEKLLSLGLLPDASLRCAWEKRDEMRTLLADGVDLGRVRKPGRVRKAKRERATEQLVADTNTFERVTRSTIAQILGDDRAPCVEVYLGGYRVRFPAIVGRWSSRRRIRA